MKPLPSSATATISSSSGEKPRRIDPAFPQRRGRLLRDGAIEVRRELLEPAQPRAGVAQERRRARREQLGERGERQQRAGEGAQVAGVPLPQHEPREEPLHVGDRTQRRGEVLAHDGEPGPAPRPRRAARGSRRDR